MQIVLEIILLRFGNISFWFLPPPHWPQYNKGKCNKKKIPPEVSEEICFVGWTKAFKACSDLPLLELLVLQVNSSEAENQTGKSKYSYIELCQRFSQTVWFSHLGLPCFSLCFSTQPCVTRRKTARRTRFVNIPARESPTARVLQAFTVTSVKVLNTGRRSPQAAGQVEGQTGVFKEELCYPTGIWSCALEEAAVMMD